MKFHCYVRALPFAAQADAGLAWLIIQRGIDYLCNLVKTRVQGACKRCALHGIAFSRPFKKVVAKPRCRLAALVAISVFWACCLLYQLLVVHFALAITSGKLVAIAAAGFSKTTGMSRLESCAGFRYLVRIASPAATFSGWAYTPSILCSHASSQPTR